MNAILSDRDEKERSDHRHHAIDAIIVAHTTAATIKKLQESAAKADDLGSHRRFAGLEPPFDIDDANRAVEAIVVSHRQNRKARGKFHKDTIYSRPLPSPSGKAKHRIRKELDKLNENEIEAVVDPRIRETVRAAFEKCKREGAKTPAQAFSEVQHRPQLSHGDIEVREHADGRTRQAMKEAGISRERVRGSPSASAGAQCIRATLPAKPRLADLAFLEGRPRE